MLFLYFINLSIIKSGPQKFQRKICAQQRISIFRYNVVKIYTTHNTKKLRIFRGKVNTKNK